MSTFFKINNKRNGKKQATENKCFCFFSSDTIEYVIELTSLHSIEIGRYSLCAIQVQTFICRVFVELFFVHLSTKPVFDEYTYMALATYTLKQSSNEKLQSLCVCIMYIHTHSSLLQLSRFIPHTHALSICNSISFVERIGFEYEYVGVSLSVCIHDGVGANKI